MRDCGVIFYHTSSLSFKTEIGVSRMKLGHLKIIGCLFLVMMIPGVHAQTAEEILAKYEAAAGGREKLEAVKTLEVISTLKMPFGGQSMDIPLTLVREKGKLFRRQIEALLRIQPRDDAHTQTEYSQSGQRIEHKLQHENSFIRTCSKVQR